MTLLEKLESGLRDRRAELINQPLARVWGELAKTAEEICEEDFKARLIETLKRCERSAIEFPRGEGG